MLNVPKTISMCVRISQYLLLLVIYSLNLPQAVSSSAYDYQSLPTLMGGNSTPPQVMISMSVDHQLFFKAYNDFDDIDGDGKPDTTYKNSIEYVGYFDSKACYQYTNNIFKPTSRTVDGYYCNKGNTTSRWSGNFLNWASMTRIDIVRKTLYGGQRSTDTSSTTILERSHLTNDAHSFAKYYNGDDLKWLTPYQNYKTGKQALDSGVTFCNTTFDMTAKQASQHSKKPPRMRAAKGNFSFWPAGERWQCIYDEEQVFAGRSTDNSYPGVLPSFGIYAYYHIPDKTHKIQDYFVRVKACGDKSDKDRESCYKYPNGNYKPIGIVQKYGQSGEIQFGLLSGSYQKNKQGGTLRKNISPLDNEVNITTDGTFKSSVTNGGIIQSVNAFRLANWYADFGGDIDNQRGTYYGDNCLWGKKEFDDGECTNWGNPFAEILLESYQYFAGKDVNPKFQADDSFVSPHLKTVIWENPINEDNYCANLNVLAFNSSTISYDGNLWLLGTGDVDGSEIKSATNQIGKLEGINGKSYFVGSSYQADNDQLCTPKVVNNLASVRGTCPDAPRLEGSYYSSGLAFHAKTNDLNSKIEGEQTINTFGFALAPSIPKMIIPRPGFDDRDVTIFPACRNGRLDGNCAIVDFKIIEPHADKDGDGTFTGMMYVTWEDSEQGGDFDQDINGVIRYEINRERITVFTRVLRNSTPYPMGFGFVLNGVNASDRLNGEVVWQPKAKGFHVLSGANEFTGGDCNKCELGDGWGSKRFVVASSTAQFLEQPLFYASKYGGFKDINGNNLPDLQEEWDTKDNYTGLPTPDGVPDNYYNVNNPGDLKISFDKVISEILASAASGTGSSVVTNARSGSGLFLQSLFYPSLTIDDAELTWVSTLNGMFMDKHNNIREDSDGNNKLTDSDKIIAVEFEPESKTMMAQRYHFGADGEKNGKSGNLVPLHELKPIWSAHKQLARVTQPEYQRNYENSAKTRRHLLTAIDSNNDGIISSSNELKPFTVATFDNNTAYLLGTNDQNTANKIVNYIRGKEFNEFRSRTANVLPSTPEQEVWRLGDIANATPLIISSPSSAYDIDYGYTSYIAFRNKYKNRRTMVYSAANDGVLHAFNGGYFDTETKTFSSDQHPLGAELWGYVPYNLLPHLRWLKEHDYPHVAFLDGSLQSFEADIFPNDADHPNGWGTILVAGMRFGGGPITVSKDAEHTRTMRSAWVVLDITNPEKPARPDAENTHPNLGFTTTNAELIKIKRTNSQGNTTNNKWFLAFGSGPHGNDATASRIAQRQAISDQSAKIFLFDLKKKTLNSFDTGVSNSFVGGLHAADWDRNYEDDALYYGLVSGTRDTPSGSLRRGILKLAGGTMQLEDSALLDVTNQAFSAPPLTRIDKQFNRWVLAGSGRFFHDLDGQKVSQNSFYGIQDNPNPQQQMKSAPLTKSSLINVSDIQTYENGEVRTQVGNPVTLNTGDPASTVDDVTHVVNANDGWYLDFPNSYARNIGQASMYSTSLIFTAFTPTDDLCSGDVGNTRLYQREFFNGLSPVYSPYIDNTKTVTEGEEESSAIATAIDLGDNYYAEPNDEGLTLSNEGELKEVELGQPQLESRREAWREINKDW